MALTISGFGERAAEQLNTLSRQVNRVEGGNLFGSESERIIVNLPGDTFPGPDNIIDKYTKYGRNDYEGKNEVEYFFGTNQNGEYAKTLRDEDVNKKPFNGEESATGFSSNPQALDLNSCTTTSNSPVVNRKVGICDDGLYTHTNVQVDSSGNRSNPVSISVERDSVSPFAPNLNLGKTGDIFQEYLTVDITGEGYSDLEMEVSSSYTDFNSGSNNSQSGSTGNTRTFNYNLGEGGRFSSNQFLSLICGQVEYTYMDGESKEGEINTYGLGIYKDAEMIVTVEEEVCNGFLFCIFGGWEYETKQVFNTEKVDNAQIILYKENTPQYNLADISNDTSNGLWSHSSIEIGEGNDKIKPGQKLCPKTVIHGKLDGGSDWWDKIDYWGQVDGGCNYIPGIVSGTNYLCNEGANISVNGVTRDDVCDAIRNYVTFDRIEYKNFASSYGVFCPAPLGVDCASSPGSSDKLSGRHIAIDPSYEKYESQYTANILLHEGQHADWDRKGKPNKELLENEFISHKFEGLLIDDRGLQTETSAGSDPAGVMFLDKTQQLFIKTGSSTWKLRNDGGTNGIYRAVCDRYYDSLTPIDKTKCLVDFGFIP